MATKTATPRDTTDEQDIELLKADIVNLFYTAPYNDMTWREIEVACQRAAYQARLVTGQYGSFNDAPPPS